MEYRKLAKTGLKVSAVGLGTWVMGGWMWGDADDRDCEEAIEAALGQGIRLIDTAPVYGFGRSEETVGRVLKRLRIRDQVVLATKFGLEWDNKKTTLRRNASPQRMLQELDDSRRRLQTDVLDLYQIHWPDESVPFERTMEALAKLQQKGTIRAIGVSNFNVAQLKRCLDVAPLDTLQPPYNLFERGIEEDVLPFCREHGIAVLGYGALCRGLLSGKFDSAAHFDKGDVRSMDPKFQKEHFEYYLTAIEHLKAVAQKKGLTVGQLAIQWAARQPGMTVVLAGARNRQQAQENAGAFQIFLSEADLEAIETIVETALPEAIGPEFMAPPRSVR